MKKNILLTIALFIAAIGQAQITVTTTAGNLKANLESATGSTTINTITDLKITGTLNGNDLAIIPTYGTSGLRNLIKLDLSGVTAIENKIIPANTFYQLTALTSVALPTDGVLTTIDTQAFSGCTKLASINIPEGIDSIGNSAFSSTSALTSITLPNSAAKLGTGIFASSGIQTIKLPDNMKVLPKGIFQRAKLTSITIPQTVTTIEADAFNGNSALPEIKLPDGLLYLSGFRTFSGTSITSLKIPEQTLITDPSSTDVRLYQTFQESKMTSFIVPANVVIITSGAFQYAPLTSITFAENGKLKTLGGLAFTELKSIKIPEGVTSLESAVFASSANLQTVEIPSTIEKIGDWAFSDCSSLESIIIHADFPVNLSSSSDVFSGVDKTTCKLYIPAGSKEAYSEADGWKDFKNIEEFSTTQTQTISNFSDITKTFNEADFALLATTSSGLDVSYVISEGNGTIAELFSDGKTVKILGTGTAKITASQAGNDKFSAATPVEIRLTVNKAQQSISGLSASFEAKTGDAPIALGATATSGLDVSYSIELGKEGVATLNGNVLTIIGVGTAKITALQLGNNNYEAATPVEITLTVTAGSGIGETSGTSAFALVENPVKDEAQFSFESAGNGARIVISDLTGKFVAQQTVSLGATEASISVSNLLSGVYLARYIDNSGKGSTVKFIK